MNAVVTGGSRGIGRAVVRELVEHGFSVAFTFESSKKEAAQIVEELGAERVPSLCCSNTDDDAVALLYDAAIDEGRTVEHLTIRQLCRRIIDELAARLPVRSITLIEPFECTEGLGGGLSVKSVRWMDRKTPNWLIDASLFVGLFVPHGTVCSISLSRGTPFVSFVSSRSTAESEGFSRPADGAVLPALWSVWIAVAIAAIPTARRARRRRVVRTAS